MPLTISDISSLSLFAPAYLPSTPSFSLKFSPFFFFFLPLSKDTYLFHNSVFRFLSLTTFGGIETIVSAAAADNMTLFLTFLP